MAGTGSAGIASARTCLSAPRANHAATPLVVMAEGVFRPRFPAGRGHRCWTPQAAGPIWIGISESHVVRVPRGHVGDAGLQTRQ